MSRIEIQNVNKYFGANHVLKNIDFVIEEGDFLTLLGPSGCGKTTTLRILTGLEDPESGIVRIGGKEVVNGENHYYAPPAKRDLSLVFQSYALWPHMTVFENVAFGLKIKKTPKREISSKVEAALEKLQIRDFKDRYPSELSGGQQQRVSIARAIVTEPKILLLDEPLSNLDAKLRLEMRAELKRLHKELGTTIIYVTHDQVEALTLSTRIAVFFEGEIAQLDEPRNIYRKPANLQVAQFVGNPQINLIPAVCHSDGYASYAEACAGSLCVPIPSQLSAGKKIVLAIYPEDVSLSSVEIEAAAEGKVYSVLPAGSETLVQVELGDGTILLAKMMGEEMRSIGEHVWIRFPHEKMNIYDEMMGKFICEGVGEQPARGESEMPYIMQERAGVFA